MTQANKIEGKFYPLTANVAKTLRQAHLTAAEWGIWSYLVEVEPWGDRYVEIETLTVMNECDCSKATFYRAIAKFQTLGLFDFQDKGFCIKNETGISKLRKGSLKHETTVSVSKLRQSSQNCDSRLKNETAYFRSRKMKFSLPPINDLKNGSSDFLSGHFVSSDFGLTRRPLSRFGHLSFLAPAFADFPAFGSMQ